MGRRVRFLSALAAGTLAFVVGTSTAHALTADQFKCQKAIAKEGAKFVLGELKAHQKCIGANLKTPASCAGADLTKLRDKLDAGLAKACTFATNTPGNLAAIGFPGPCTDANPVDKFTLADLQDCIQDSHEDVLTGVCGGGTNTGQACNLLSDCPDQGSGTYCRGMIGVEYDSTVVNGPLTGTQLKCQQEIAKNAVKVVSTVLKSVQKCRNALLDCKTDPVTNTTTCKLEGVSPKNCAVPVLGDAKTIEAIAKAEAKANAAITGKCSDGDAGAIGACEPNIADGALAAACEVDFHHDMSDNPDPTAVSDLIDYEYAQRGLCGDNRQNQPSEECDGLADTACPGQCGAPLGFFPCLCQDSLHKRTRVVEHSNADLDNGFSGQSHDSGIVEGGGYVTELYDCDGPAGPITICTVGPTCSGGTHSSCTVPHPGPANNPPVNLDTGDEICASLGEGTCRKTAGGSTGPHCEQEFQRWCRNDGNCAVGDRCVITPHGAPLPISSGGVSVCVVNTFSQDIVGTTNLATGDGAVSLRQISSTYLGPDTQQPCPVCGGFCSGSAGTASPGTRNLCSSNADCTNPGSVCVTESVCGWGPNKDKACRPNPPGGGLTEFFGNPSVDCPMSGDLLGSLDIWFNPATTGSTTKTANLPCNTTGFNNKTCAGGSNQHAVCTVDSECPGGTCNSQCFCGGGSQKPNECQAACIIPGGASPDGQACIDDSECPGGFCHPADCRLNIADTDSAQEGLCSVGPVDKHCSTHTFFSCTANSGCSNIQVCTGGPNDNVPCTAVSECPGGGCGTKCPFCDNGEICGSFVRQCFVNPTIIRSGTTAGYVPLTNQNRTSVANFCIAKTSSDAVNGVAGLPGPGAITNPTTTIEVGF
jgi:hypothetical protein